MKLIGTYIGLPRILVPTNQAARWKKGLGEALIKVDNVDRVSFDVPLGDAKLFAIDSDLGAVGWLPTKAGGGTFVCWLDAKASGTGSLADGKIVPLLPPKTKPLGQCTLDGPQLLACNDLSPDAKGFDWIEVPLIAGRYDVGFAPARKTPLGKLAFITFTPVSTVGSIAAPKPQAAKPTAKKLATVTGGPEGVVLLPAAAVAYWSSELWSRAATLKAVKSLTLNVGQHNALVFGSDLAMTLYSTDSGALMVVHGGTPANEALGATTKLAKWKRRAQPFKIDAKGVVLAYSETEDRKAGVSKPLALSAGEYDVDYVWGANVEGTMLSAIRLTRRS